MLTLRKEYEATSGKFIEHDAPVELFPGAWLSGPVPRTYPEKNWSVSGQSADAIRPGGGHHP